MSSLVAPVLFLGGFGALLWWMQTRLVRQGYRPGRLPPTRTIRHPFHPESSARFRGGSRVGRLNATVPFVALSIDREWAHLSGLAPVWIDRREVQAARAITSALPGDGLRFVTDDGALDGVIFWTFDAPAVTEAFVRLGWPVDTG